MSRTGTARADRLGASWWWYLSARIISDFGDRALIVILPFAAIELDAGAFGVSVLLVASQLPLLAGLVLMSSFGGMLPRQLSLVVSDTLRAGLQSLVFVLFITGHASLVLLVVLQAVAAFVSAVAIPVSEAAVADLVPQASRQRANATLQSGRSIVRILAPGVAGALAELVGVNALFLLDALTFVLSAGIVSSLAFPAHQRVPPRGRLAAKAIRSKRWLVLSSTGSAAINALAVAPVLVLGPLVVERVSGGPGAWGVVMTAFGVGAAAGAVLLLRKPIRHPLRVAFLVAPIVCVLPLSLAAGLHIGWLCVAALVTGWQATVFNVTNETARQTKLEDELRVQGAAFATLLAFGLNPVGLVVAGAAAAAATDSSVLYAAAIFGIVIPVVVLMSRDVWSLTLTDDRDGSAGGSQIR